MRGQYYLGMAVLAQLLARPILMNASELQTVDIIWKVDPGF